MSPSRSRLPFYQDLGLQLLLYYALVLIPVLLAALSFDRFLGERLQADARASDLALARAIAQETDTVLQNALQAVRQMATYPAVQQADPEGMRDLFQAILTTRPDLNLIYRLAPDGLMVYHYPEGPRTTVGINFSFRAYYQQALHTNTPFISAGRISPTTQQPVATAVMPIYNEEGAFQGVVATNIKLQFLSHALRNIARHYPPGNDFQVMILDSTGKVIAHNNPAMLLSDMGEILPDITNRALNGETGSEIAYAPPGEEILVSYLSIPSVNWGVVVRRPTAVAFATQRALHRLILLGALGFVLIGLFFWLSLARQVIRPLEDLAELSQSIGQRELPPTERLRLHMLSQRPDQMGYLVKSLLRMEQTIQARLQELSTLLETSASVVSTLDTQTVLNRILEEVERLLQVDKSAIIALDERRGIFRARASRNLTKNYIERLVIDPAEPVSVTLRALRSGEPIQVSDTENDPSFRYARPRARAEGYRAVIAIPLHTQHAPPTALVVYRSQPHVFTQAEINLLTSFANHAAMAIENATLYERSDMRLQAQTRRLQALIQSLDDGLILEDLHGRVVYANRRISALSGIDLAALPNTPVDTLLNAILERCPQGEESLAAITSLREQPEGGAAEVRLVGDSGMTYQRVHVFTVRDSQDTLIGRGQLWHDFTADRELDNLKSSLISTVSHELRTPLAAIKGYATTLLADDVQWDETAQREFLTIISQETDRLSALVNDLLDLSRIEAGNLKIEPARIPLEDLVYRVARRSSHPLLNRLHLDIASNARTLEADPRRLEVVLRNLMENAAKYAPGDTPIWVRARKVGDAIQIEVADQGPGIPPEHRKRIFESFYRVESGLTRSAPGAGLGLAICQGFVRAHGGRIWLENREDGTTFAFSIPQKRHTGSLQPSENPPQKPYPQRGES
ncbi:MAG: GAF domain-containing protein [Anaerolineae bacterium]|nr:MAG: GAF domain-containing protein [Anaerolineae bacterium]